MEFFFKEMLDESIAKAVEKLGFTSPTPIQEKTIPLILKDKSDLIALAQTGTGKTAGFGLPIVQLISNNNAFNQALILCPTRELCLQISKDLSSFLAYKKEIKVSAVYGGTNISEQLKALKQGVHIIVGTPGRTLDLIKRKALNISSINWLVLDEADEMLQMGFKEELDAILKTSPKEKQTLLFSATMPNEVRKIAENYMNNPIDISVSKQNISADSVKHIYYMVKAADRYLALKRIADIHPNIYGIVFCRTRKDTKELADKLIQDGYNADALHGDLSQSQRDFVMNRFRIKALQLLVATDVAARGLDVNDLTHVINFNLPDELEVYIHRSGRTGRAGKSGTSIAIIHSREMRKIRDVEKLIGKKFEYKKIPTGYEICEKRLFSLIDKVEQVEVNENQIEKFLPVILNKLSWLSRDELIKHFVSVEFNHFLAYYKNADDLNVSVEKNSKTKSKKGHSNTNFSRFYINLGSKHKINASQLIGIINKVTKTDSLEIGKIDILRNFSFFEVDNDFQKLVIQSFVGQEKNGVMLNVQLSSPSNHTDDKKSKSKKSTSRKPQQTRAKQKNKSRRKR